MFCKFVALSAASVATLVAVLTGTAGAAQDGHTALTDGTTVTAQAAATTDSAGWS
ncbi:hypothetical protein [Streptomyces sp. TRM70350]|uniref:hypothetical protein n=1 Tax=Streptomyces sp. TRM70350 TaxID=2856165 RepID=UPI001C453A9C|nr:hypothetical protein [Streptomyces sp. TRM70350]MBV7699283.1 hypothetical protein [Streptomyces sp. TRM70350]